VSQPTALLFAPCLIYIYTLALLFSREENKWTETMSRRETKPKLKINRAIN
jgi:hypothetical protein